MKDSSKNEKQDKGIEVLKLMLEKIFSYKPKMGLETDE